MKTIEIMSKDHRDYIINISQITCLHDSSKESGTFLTLSCGTKICVDKSMYELKEIIKQASK